MKGFKKIMSLLLVAVLSTSMLAACSKSDGGNGGGTKGETTETLESVIEKTLAKDKEVTSLESEYIMDVQVLMKAQGMSADMAIKAEGTTDYVKDPQTTHVTMKMTMEIPFNGTQTQDVEMYTVNENGEEVSYTSTDGGNTWTKGAAQAQTSNNEVQAGQGLKELQDAGVEMTLEGTEEFGGVNCFVIKADIDAEDMKIIMEKAGGSYGDSVSSLESLIGEGVDIRYVFTAYVSTETYEFKGFNIDMKDAMDAAMKKAADDAASQGVSMEVVTDTAYMTMIFKSYNTLDKIDIPSNVK